jgi:hypothetical protein
MSTNRTIVILLTITVVSLALVVPGPAADQGSAKSGPSLGKWEFTGKDNTGLVWSGTLSIEKLDPARFDPNKYHSLCSLEVQSSDPAKGTKGVEAPCEWNPGTRTVSFGNTYPAANVYTAILSGDGKVLTQGKWTESKIVRGQVGGIVRSGEWSAKLSNR